MAVDTKQFLDFASSIDASAGEMHARTKVNRSYYAAFHTARMGMTTKLGNGHIEFAKSTHENVKKHYCDSGNRAHKSIGYTLADLRTQRNEADYVLDAGSISALDADQVHLRCIELIARVEALPNVSTQATPGSADETLSAPVAERALDRPLLTIIK